MPTEPRAKVALVHDYLTQRGGAERVALLMARTFPDATLTTALYEPDATFEEFSSVAISTLWPNRIGPIRKHHRLGLALYANAFSSSVINADVTVASSSGWAHGVTALGAKVVYCHAPARWLYQQQRYLSRDGSTKDHGVAKSAASLAAHALRSPLVKWDKRAAASAQRYLVNSRVTKAAVESIYGIDAELLAPPPALDRTGPVERDVGDEGAILVVARLLPYKHVDLICEAAVDLGRPIIVVGEGPERARLTANFPTVRFVGAVSDARLRGLYASAAVHVAASFEDFGLSPLEAACFGTPTVALRAGGYLDTVIDGVTGTFFDDLEPTSLRRAIDATIADPPKPDVLIAHAATFSPTAFAARLREVTAEVAHHELARPAREGPMQLRPH